MKNTMLFGNDMIELEELLNIVSDIKALYDKLCLLDFEGKKESSEYKAALSELGKKIYLEEEMYKKLMQSDSKCIAIINYLCELIENKSVMNSKKRDANVYRRIIFCLIEKFTNSFVETAEESNNDSLSQSVITIENINSEIKKAFDLETFINSLMILEEYANNKDYDKFRAPLISIKYDSPFNNKNVEKDMLSKGYTSSKQTCFVSKRRANLLNMSESSYKDSSFDYVNAEALTIVFRLLNISDSDYSYKDFSYSSILLRTQLRALLLILDDKGLSDWEINFEETAKSPEYINSKISIQFVREIIEKAKTDKTLYKPDSGSQMTYI